MSQCTRLPFNSCGFLGLENIQRCSHYQSKGYSCQTRAQKLPGTLPPTRASLPVILLPAGDGPWIAVMIIQWRGYDGAHALLNAVARSVR